jgi:carboxymethylenebutenolidase
VYENAGHAFHNDTGTNYNSEAACDAWAKTLAFLNRHLSAGG